MTSLYDRSFAANVHVSEPPAATVRSVPSKLQPEIVGSVPSFSSSVSGTTSASSGFGLLTVIEPDTSKFSSNTVSSTVTVQSKVTVSPANADCDSGLTVFSTSHSCRSSYVPAAVFKIDGM